MIPLNHILRKFSAGYKLSKTQTKINDLMYMDDIKLFAKNEKELKTVIKAVRIYCQDKGIEFIIEKYAMPIMEKEGNDIRQTEWNYQIRKTLQRSE